MNLQHINLIVVLDRNNGISKNGKIPWRIKSEMEFFKKKTTGDGNNCVIMGSKTLSTIPPKFSPLKDRHNIVISTKTYNNDNVPPGVEVASSLDDALLRAADGNFESIFIIGGKQVYEEMLGEHLDLCKNIYVSVVPDDFECDQRIDYDFISLSEGVYNLNVKNCEGFDLYHFERNV
jgi:dihydrofolate reductase